MMIFGSPYMSACEPLIFKNFVSTPHNYGLIMGDRIKNFKDPMLCGRDIRKTKYHNMKLLRFFLNAL